MLKRTAIEDVLNDLSDVEVDAFELLLLLLLKTVLASELDRLIDDEEASRVVELVPVVEDSKATVELTGEVVVKLELLVVLLMTRRLDDIEDEFDGSNDGVIELRLLLIGSGEDIDEFVDGDGKELEVTVATKALELRLDTALEELEFLFILELLVYAPIVLLLTVVNTVTEVLVDEDDEGLKFKVDNMLELLISPREELLVEILARVDIFGLIDEVVLLLAIILVTTVTDLVDDVTKKEEPLAIEVDRVLVVRPDWEGPREPDELN